jgi:DNA adenine methylase
VGGFTVNGKSFLKWAGGKTRYAETLVALAPPFSGTYWEPFMGSAAVFFELAPSKAVLSDANEELVICFQQVAADPEAVMALLDEMPNTRDYFHAVRRQKTHDLTDLQRAARVIYLNKTSFRGLWRVNRRGEFNVPYGDYGDALQEARAGDWVYLDPPYVPLGGYSDFKRYTPGQFHDEDHKRLVSLMRDAADRGVYLMLTNANTPAVKEMYEGFGCVPIATRRDINLKASERASADLVVTNYDSFRQQQLAV